MKACGPQFSMYSSWSLFPHAAPEKPLIENSEMKKEDLCTPDIITQPTVPNCSSSNRPCKHQEKRQRMEREREKRRKRDEEGLNLQEGERYTEHTGKEAGEGTGE